MAKNETPGYYAIIPADVRYNNSISANAKLLYGEITALSNSKGYAFAYNKYFADLYNVKKRTVSRWINQLKENNYIRVDLVKKQDGAERRMYLSNITGGDKNVMGEGQNCLQPHDNNVEGGDDKNVVHNTTSSNNTRKTTTIANLPEITPKMEKVIEAWNDTFEIVVDDSDRQLLEAIAKATQKFEVSNLLQAIRYRSQAKYYKEEVPYLRDNPRSFFGYSKTIKNDMNRRPYKLITYSRKCELEQKGTDRRFEIDPEAKDQKGQPKWRMYND